MATITERKLHAKLARVEALHEGATTEGERRAAARARERLIERARHLRANDPVARFCKDHIESLGVPPNRPPAPRPVPSGREVLGALACWESRDWTRRRVRLWAAQMVDQCILPADPEDEGACRSEVLLQLAALHHIRLKRTDVPRIRRFLRDRDWRAWFDLVAEAASR